MNQINSEAGARYGSQYSDTRRSGKEGPVFSPKPKEYSGGKYYAGEIAVAIEKLVN